MFVCVSMSVGILFIVNQGDDFYSQWIGCNELCFRFKDTAATSSVATDAVVSSSIIKFDLRILR